MMTEDDKQLIRRLIRHADWRLVEVRPARLGRVRGGMALIRDGTAIEVPWVPPPAPWERQEPPDFAAIAAIAANAQRERERDAGA